MASVAVSAALWWHSLRTKFVRVATPNIVLDSMDGGHPTDATMESFEETQKVSEDVPGGADGGLGVYMRWAARLANEYKLEFGIPKRTEANRQLVRTVLFKRLKERNTRYAHMRSVIPIALEMCFLKDATDMEVDRVMLMPEMVKRAQESVVPYWKRNTWAGWFARHLLPPSAVHLLAQAYPGTFRAVPIFVE